MEVEGLSPFMLALSSCGQFLFWILIGIQT